METAVSSSMRSLLEPCLKEPVVQVDRLLIGIDLPRKHLLDAHLTAKRPMIQDGEGACQVVQPLLAACLWVGAALDGA